MSENRKRTRHYIEVEPGLRARRQLQRPKRRPAVSEAEQLTLEREYLKAENDLLWRVVNDVDTDASKGNLRGRTEDTWDEVEPLLTALRRTRPW